MENEAVALSRVAACFRPRYNIESLTVAPSKMPPSRA